MNNYTIVASFYLPNYLKSNTKSLIASTYFIENESVKLNPLNNKDINNNLKKLNLNDYNLLVVKPESEDNNWVSGEADPKDRIVFSRLKNEIFFSEGFVNIWYPTFTEDWQYDCHYIIMFLDTNWETVVKKFHNLGIEIVEIDPKYSHMLTPNQTRLSIFLLSIFGKIYIDSTLSKDSFPKIHDIKYEE